MTQEANPDGETGQIDMPYAEADTADVVVEGNAYDGSEFDEDDEEELDDDDDFLADLMDAEIDDRLGGEEEIEIAAQGYDPFLPRNHNPVLRQLPHHNRIHHSLFCSCCSLTV